MEILSLIIQASQATNIAKAAGVGTAALGVFFFMSAFLPESWRTYKTKNTVGINKNMFILHGIVGLLFLLGALCLIAEVVAGGADTIKSRADNFIVGILFSINTACSFAGCVYTFLLKLKNSKEAREQGISEQAHYEKNFAHLADKSKE